MIASPSADLVGRTLGDFVVRSVLGEGGQGVVYRAEQPALGREAVIKVIRGADELVPRFLREARLASKLDHPYAAHVYAFGAEPDGLLWIAMELVRGTPLDKVLAAQGPMPLERFVPFFERLCEVVHTAHEQGIVHRDLKPANVMVVARAGRIMPKLLDLGIAKGQDAAFEEAQAGTIDSLPVADQGLTQKGEIVGSPRYMAPEQWVNSPTIDGRTDIYALGVVAYEVVTGSRPFAGTTMRALARAHAKNAVPPLGDRFPPALHEVLSRAMAKKQADRFTTALDLGVAVRAASGLEAEREALPRLDEETRASALTDLPYPIAEAIAALDVARHGHQARDAVWEIGSVLCLYLGTLALACRSRLGKRPDPEILLPLTRRGLSDVEWLELVRKLCAPYARERDLFPIPELVGFALDGAGELEALVAAERAGSFSEEQLRPILTKQLASLGRTLRALGFLADYPLVTMREQAVEAWMGTRRRSWSASRVEEGDVCLLDARGSPVLRLSPLVQAHEPTPGAGVELFFFAGKGRRGARLLAPPRGFERTDEAFWGWFKEGLFGDGGEEGAASVEAVPYRGLASFSRDDAALFFGREAETEAFSNRLRVTPLLAVVGPSGAGKSSFVEAGVIPSLGEGWQVVTMRPGAAPLATLEARLDGVRGPTLFVVDQFEELFTLGAPEEERRAFAAKLVAAARDPVRVVLTLRDDFLIRATELGPFRERIGPGLQLLTTPAREDLLRILTLPAERAGYRFEEADLPAKMVDAVAGQPGALALLSFTASRLWELRDRHFKQLTRKAYDALGGVAGALAQHAESVRSALAIGEQRLVRDAFRALVTAEGTRAVLGRSELLEILGGTPAAARVIDQLVDARLLVTTETESGGTVEVIHEALLSSWPRLVEWRREDAEGARLRDQLRAAARQWDERGRAAGLLWRTEALAEYERWRARYPGQLTAVEAAFGDASVGDARRSQRNRRLLLAGAFVALSAGMVIALFLNRRATIARGDAEQKTVRLLQDQGRQYMLQDDPVRAYPYLAAAVERGGMNPALGYLLGRAHRLLDVQLAVLQHDAFIHEIDLDPSDRRLVTAAGDGIARVYSVPDGTLLASLPGQKHAVLALAISPSGNRLATGDAGGTIRIWDLTSLALVARKEVDGGAVIALAWSDDERLLVAGTRTGSVHLWQPSDGQVRVVPLGGQVRFLAVVDEGKTLLAAETGGALFAIHLPDGEPAKLLQTSAGIQAFAPSTTRARFAITSRDAITIWDHATQTFLPEIRVFMDGPLTSVLSPDGTRLAVLSVGEGGVIVPVGRDLTMIPLSGHTAPMTAVAYSPDGRWLATSASDGAIFLRDAETGVRQTTLLGHAARVRRLRFTRDGQVLASASTDGTVRFWRLEAPEIVRTIRAHSSRVYSLDRATEDRRVVSAANDGFVRVWDVSEGRKTAEVEVGTELLAAKLSPNGRAVAVLRATGYTLYDATLERPRGGVTSLTGVKSLEFFDDARLLLGTETGDVVEWDLGTSREQRRWRAHEGAVESIERTSRGQIVTVTGGSAALWDPDGSLVRRFADATFLSASASSPDGSRILVFGLPRAPSIWTASDGRRLQTLEGHTSDVRAACYTTDGRLLVTTGMDETLRVWDGDEGTLLSTVTLPAEVGFSLAPGARPDEVLVGLLDGRILVWTLAPAEPKADVLGCKAPYAIGPDLRVSLRSACGGR